MPLVKWNEDFYVRAYELARTGISDTKMAKALGVSGTILMRWRKRYPALQRAIDRAREEVNGDGSFLDYVYDRLSPELQELWDEIQGYEEQENGILKIEALLQSHGKFVRQNLFCHALIHHNFNLSKACKAVNVPHKTFESWKLADPRFAELLAEMLWHKKNFFDGALCRLVKNGDTSATIFANKTFNREIYGEKIQVEHTGQVNHLHGVVNIDSLNLPIEVRKKMLEAIEEQEQQQGELVEV